MSFDGNENAPGCGSGGVRKDEELGMGRFGNDIAAVASHQAPLFKPEQLKAFRGSGFELIPLNAWNALDAKGRKMGKAPGKGWRDHQPLDADEAGQAMLEGRNVGVRLRACDLIVDVDPRNFPEGTDPFRQLQEDIGISLLDFPTVVTGSGGLHIYMRKPDDLLVRDSLESYQGVEFKALGRQVVAPGSVHPDTGEPYLWDDLGPKLADGVPNAPEALIDLIRRPERASAAGGGEIDAEQLAEMLTGLNAEDYRDQVKWFNLMAACHHATAGGGREEFIAWSTSDALYSGHDHLIGRRWDSLHADRQDGFKVGTLYKALHDVGRGDLIPRPNAQDDFADHLDDQVMERIAVENAAAPKRNGVADEWVYVIDAEAFVRRSDGKKWKKEQWKARYAGMMSQGDIINAVFRGNFPVRKFEALVYIPGGAEFPDGEQGGRYNIWKPSGVDAQGGDVSPFLDHMAYLFPDQEECGFVLDYLAMLVQRPEQKVNYALLVKGGQGTGKSWIGRLMTRIIGSPNVTQPSNSEVMSQWTAWTEGAQLGIIEELMCVGRLDMANRLKPIITEPTLRIEAKGCSLYSIPNHLNLMAFTNHDDAVPIERGDRRWLVVFSDAESRDDAYYERLFDYLDGNGPSAVKQWLLDREIRLNPKGRAPKTKGKAEMRRLSLSEAEQHLAEMLEEGVAPFDFDLVRLDDLIDAVPAAVQRQTKGIRNRVIRWLKEEAGAVKHNRYTKQDGTDRLPYQLWSIRAHDRWTEVGAAGRIDAFLDHTKVIR